MTSVYTSKTFPSFSSLYNHLKTCTNKRSDPILTDKISSLYVHPTLETLLHLLNHDLDSAHFLVRHMQSPPAYEGMYAHGILHRIEGDFDNCRAWYADVCTSEAFEKVWGKATREELQKAEENKNEKKIPAQSRVREFIDNVETLKKDGNGEKERLEKEGRREIETLMQWCIDKFGTDKYDDATQAWVQASDGIKSKGQDMVSGGQGFRKF